MIKFNKNNNDINNKKHFTIRDIRIGTIINIHLRNNDRGDKGFVDCEIIAVFNSAGQKVFNINGDFCIIHQGNTWFGYCDQISKILSY